MYIQCQTRRKTHRKGLRKEAKKRGYDPNIWLDNVEVIAAEKIGSETVTYVSSIYKYYIAYKLIEEKRKKQGEAKKSLKSGSGETK